jgi:hypothetical protein
MQIAGWLAAIAAIEGDQPGLVEPCHVGQLVDPQPNSAGGSILHPVEDGAQFQLGHTMGGGPMAEKMHQMRSKIEQRVFDFINPLRQGSNMDATQPLLDLLANSIEQRLLTDKDPELNLQAVFASLEDRPAQRFPLGGCGDSQRREKGEDFQRRAELVFDQRPIDG